MRFAEFLKDQKIIRPEKLLNQPKISVIMPTYCRAHDGLLTRSIQCVLSQSYSDFEFIIVDDGSTDGSQDIIQDFQKQDHRIIYIRHEINSGLPALRVDEGILLSRGDYLAFAFDDDEWFPSFLNSMILTAKDRNASFVHCQAEYRLIGKIHHPSFPTVEPTYYSLLQCNKIANATVLLHKKVTELYGLYNPHVILRRFCDWDLWLRIARVESPCLLPEVLVRVNGDLPDSISLKMPAFSYEEWIKMMGVSSNVESLTPGQILNFGLTSIDILAKNSPELMPKLNKLIISPWLNEHYDLFKRSNINTLDMTTNLEQNKKRSKDILKKESPVNRNNQPIKKRFKGHTASTPISWGDLPLKYHHILSDESVINHINNNFLLYKSNNIQNIEKLTYDINVHCSSLCSIQLAPAIDTLIIDAGIIMVEVVSKENQRFGYAHVSASKIDVSNPIDFFFEPPITHGEYQLKITAKGFTVPISFYELRKGTIYKPFMASKYYSQSVNSYFKQKFPLTHNIINNKNDMPHILITSAQRTASDELGAIIPLSAIQQQDLCTIKYKEDRYLTFEDIAWCDILFVVRGCSSHSLRAAKEAKKHGRLVLGYWDDDLLNIPEDSLSYAFISAPEIRNNISSLFKLTDEYFSPNQKLVSRFTSVYKAKAHILIPPWIEIRSDKNILTNGKQPVVGFAGSLDNIAIWDLFLNPVINEVASKNVDFKLQIMGPRPYCMGKLPVENTYIPYIYNYYDYLAFSSHLHWDIALAPQIKNEFNTYKYHNRFLESTQIGAAGIYSKTEPYTLVIQDGITGLLVEDDTEAWTESILRLLKDSDLRHKIAGNAFEYVNSSYNLTIVAQQYAASLEPFLKYKAPKVNKYYYTTYNIINNKFLNKSSYYVRLINHIKLYGIRHLIKALLNKIYK
jgi:glycosyltransferase involved in cell wall biosynthesis